MAQHATQEVVKSEKPFSLNVILNPKEQGDLSWEPLPMANASEQIPENSISSQPDNDRRKRHRVKMEGCFTALRDEMSDFPLSPCHKPYTRSVTRSVILSEACRYIHHLEDSDEVSVTGKHSSKAGSHARYSAKLEESFTALRNSVPSLDPNERSRASMMMAACEYIRFLRSRNHARGTLLAKKPSIPPQVQDRTSPRLPPLKLLPTENALEEQTTFWSSSFTPAGLSTLDLQQQNQDKMREYFTALQNVLPYDEVRCRRYVNESFILRDSCRYIHYLQGKDQHFTWTEGLDYATSLRESFAALRNVVHSLQVENCDDTESRSLFLQEACSYIRYLKGQSQNKLARGGCEIIESLRCWYKPKTPV